ncbi:MAG: GspH/FimT family pseudopilin [Candidatus Omnitrophica bacterium]|nr:GspH/FimT family pseudopilin [Candidatus Omnitrophota bacterium]
MRRKGFIPLEMKSLTGFTFIEIMMVIVILAIFVSLTTPRFRTTYLDLELSNHARRLAKLLNYAQERAVIEGKTYRLQVDLIEKRYWLTTESAVEEEGKFERLAGRYGRTTQLPFGISLEFEKEEIFFYPDGSSDPFTLSLRNEEGKQLMLKDGKPFGYVRVEERPPT